MYDDLRDEYMSRVVPGNTFADVGGLWGTVSEKVSVAHRMGATGLAMIDMQPEGNEWWQKFHERMRGLEVSGYQSICATIDQIKSGGYDVVHCSGVLYHHPNPLSVLTDLRSITRRHLVLTSAISQERIVNEFGEFSIGESGVLFVPGLSEADRLVLSAYWKTQGANVFGITTRVEYRLDDFGPWWWLPTAHALRGMVEVCGFRVLDAGHTWNNNSYTLLCETKA